LVPESFHTFVNHLVLYPFDLSCEILGPLCLKSLSEGCAQCFPEVLEGNRIISNRSG